MSGQALAVAPSVRSSPIIPLRCILYCCWGKRRLSEYHPTRVRCHRLGGDRLSINLSSPSVGRHWRGLIQSSPPFLRFVFSSSSLLIEFISIWATIISSSSSSCVERPGCCRLLYHASSWLRVTQICTYTGGCGPLRSRVVVAWLRA